MWPLRNQTNFPICNVRAVSSPPQGTYLLNFSNLYFVQNTFLDNIRSILNLYIGHMDNQRFFFNGTNRADSLLCGKINYCNTYDGG